MLTGIFHEFRSCAEILSAWRRETARLYRTQFGLFLALPVIWGCLDNFVWPSFAVVGFLAMAWFLEGRIGKRLAAQSLLFAVWSLYLCAFWPPSSARLGDDKITTGFSHALQTQTQTQTIIGTVAGIPKLFPTCVFLLATEKGLMRIQTHAPEFHLQSGQELSLRVVESPVLAPTNPGQFDFPNYLLSLGVRGNFRAEKVTLIKPAPWYHRCINFIHATLDSSLTRSVPAAQAPLLRACLLGSMEGLDPQVVEDFRASGMLHILAISGQHIGLIALILLQLFSLLRLPRKAAFVVTGILLGIYVPVCGGSISVLRSALMFWCLLPGVLWERPGLAMNNLGWAAALSLICMPYQILSLGFQLSFIATFFLILYSRLLATVLKRLKIRKTIPTYLLSTALFSMVLYLATYPILSNGMHSLSPSSLLGNLATIALSSGMLVASCLTLLFQPLPWIRGGFGEMAGAFSEALTFCVHALAHGPGSAQSVAALPFIWSLLLILLLLAFPYVAARGRGRLLILIAITIFSGRWVYGQVWSWRQEPMAVTYLDVGQGDGIVCQLPAATLLIDAGPPEAGRNVVLPFLRYHGINRLDVVVVTHPDLDHYGGLAYLAEHMEIGQVVYPGIEADTRAWKDLQRVLDKHKIPMTAVHRGQLLYQYPGISMHVLTPKFPGQFRERNDNSVATLLKVREKRFLFTGDMEAPAQAFLLDQAYPKLAGAILKVPHHGSDRSNPPEFLEKLKPDIAILSAGRKNRFGHPGPVTVQTLQRLGSQLFLTARQGAVFFAEDRSQSHWSTWTGKL
jgi:competence protein ComEC